ncbi:DinB family protein [Hyalangium gracile]|uniref:DinB family protein n=1 Tax=Hyalangium gracile TaxID=394092 RepID=UPI001CCD2804|nr:DinB family protein [Hyalangium gracile]
MFTPPYCQTLARYNQWANERLYAACAELTDADYRAPRQAFFGSIHGTLNHLLVADRIWMGRLEGPDSGLNKLDQILYEDFAELRAARAAEDQRLIRFMDRLGQEALDSVLSYKSTTGVPQEVPVAWILAHLFNHQTHHRGQTHGLLSQTAVAPPPLDLFIYMRQSGAQPAPSRPA